MAWSTPLKADVKAYLGLGLTTDDTLIDALLTRAQTNIETATRRKFEVAADTTRRFDAVRDTYPPPGDSYAQRIGALSTYRTLYLDEDLCQITSVTNGDSTTVASSSYVTEPRNVTPWYALRLKASAGIIWTYASDPENAITIVGRWGFSLTPPGDVVQACIDLVVWMYRRRGAEASGMDMPTVSPSGVMLFPPGFPETIKTVITSYRKVTP